MKKLFLVATALVVMMCGAFAQDTKGFSFQGIARDPKGAIYGASAVTLTITLKNGNTDVYQESHNTTTDAYGVFNLTIGKGTPASGNDFTKVDFSVNLNADISISVNGGTATTIASYALQAVPYAKYANNAATATLAINGCPPGSIMAYGGSTVPAGWVICDGSAYDGANATYKSLFAAIGRNWGNGANANANSFNVPDLRGMFLRGVDGGRGSDNGAASRSAINNGNATGVGSYEGDANKSHNHTGTTSTNGAHNHKDGLFDRLLKIDGHQTFNSADDGSAEPNLQFSGVIQDSGNHSHTFTTESSGDSEARPENMAVYYIIKL